MMQPEIHPTPEPVAGADALTEVERRPTRLLLREHEALPGLPQWCACGHQAETIYQRETHLIESVWLAAVADLRAERDEARAQVAAVEFTLDEMRVTRPAASGDTRWDAGWNAATATWRDSLALRLDAPAAAQPEAGGA